MRTQLRLLGRFARAPRLMMIVLMSVLVARCEPSHNSAEPTSPITGAEGGNADTAAIFGATLTGKPAAITDLTAIAATDTTITVTFTEVDDGISGPAGYDIRSGVAPTPWWLASSVASGPCRSPIIGTAIGTKRTCTIYGLAPARTYSIMIVGYRGTFNVSAVFGPISPAITYPTTARVASVSVTPGAPSVAVGQAAQLTATARDSAGNTLSGRTFKWASSDTTLARVDSTGLVTGVKAGTATVTASTGIRSGQAQVTVTGGTTATPPAAVTDLRAISATDSTITVRFTEVDDGTGAAAGYDIRSGVAPKQWWEATSIPRGACASPVIGTQIGALRTCTIYGLARGTNYSIMIVPYRGTFNVSAVFGPISPAITYATAAAAIAVASVTISPASATVTQGQAVQLTATTRDAGGNVLTGRTIGWSSNNTGVATVNGSGLVTGLAGGSVTITATSEGRSGTAAITVSSSPTAVASVTISPSSAALLVGQSSQFSVTLRDAGGNVLTGRPVTWVSSNTSVATVSPSGLATGVSAGSATVTATSEGRSGQSALTVSASVSPPPPPPPSSGTPLFQDGFESGNLSHMENGAQWRAGEAVVSSSIAHSGTRSIRFTVSQGNPEQRFSFTNPLSEIWLEWYQYFPNGTEGLGARYAFRDGPSADNNKFLRLWADTYDPGPRFKAGFSTLPVKNTSQDAVLETEYARSGGMMDYYPGGYIWSPAITDAYRGRWVQFRAHVKTSSPANNDGVIQLWADGVLKNNNTNLALYPTGGVQNYIRNGYLMGWQNSGFNLTTYTYIDDVRFYSSNPGW